MRSFECTDSMGGFNFRRIVPVLLGLFISTMAVIGCDDATTTTTAPVDDPRTTFNLQTLGSIPYPPDNPPRQERIALGRLLFFDPIMGGEQDVACGTCHHPDFGFADGRQFGAGTSGSGLGPNRIVSRSAVTNQPVELEPRHASITDNMLPPVLVDSLHLTDEEVAAVASFMEALTDNGSMINPMLLKVPDAVPSGLMPVFGVKGPGSGVAPMAAHRTDK
jgi:hypothetical protein